LFYEYSIKLDNKEDTVILPLMVFADGMQIDKNGHICQEPWMYMLGIFKQSIRNHPHAWHNLGLIKINTNN